MVTPSWNSLKLVRCDLLPQMPGEKSGLVSQLNFTSWKLDVPVADAMFTFQPPVRHGQVEFRDFVDALDSRIIPSDRQGPSTVAPGAKPASGPTAR
jgi:hypothetical protein